MRCITNPETVGCFRPVLVGLALWGALTVLWEALGTPRRGAGMAGRRLRLSPAAPGPVVWHVALIVDVIMLCTAAITDFQIGRIRLPRAAAR